MKMKNKRLIILMMLLLNQMDVIIREYGDEDVLEPWLMNGVPDCATAGDLDFIASDLGEFCDVCACFTRRMEQIYEIEKEG